MTPLGSNNGLYPIINNLFLVIPVSLLVMAEMFRQSRKSVNGFAFRLVISFILLCTSVQSVLFGIGFVFHEPYNPGELQDNERLSLQCGSAGTGLMTTAAKKAQLSELDQYLMENELHKKQVILYGDIPALGYLLDMEPAISSLWPDLDSYGYNVLTEQLDSISAEHTQDNTGNMLPVIIFGRAAVEPFSEPDSIEERLAYKYKKYAAVMEFAEANGYAARFENDGYILYTSD